MTTPVLSIGDLEPVRPTVSIGRNVPDGRWQQWKFDHLDLLLRWFPVRFAYRKDEYALRLPSEFGMRRLQRMRAIQESIAGLQGRDDDPAAMRLLIAGLRRIGAMVLDAPPGVVESLGPVDLMRVIAVFPSAVTGQMPTKTAPTENPPTSDDSSPASAGSTPATVGGTG